MQNHMMLTSRDSLIAPMMNPKKSTPACADYHIELRINVYVLPELKLQSSVTCKAEQPNS